MVLCLDDHISDNEGNYFSDENDQDIDSESNEETDDSFVQDSNVDEVEDEVDENENDEEGNDDWSDECPELIPIGFQGNAGPTFEKLRTPLDYFNKLFTDDLSDMLLQETIRYARIKKPDFTLNAVELQAFLGVTMIMSMIKVPFIEDYWSHDDVFGQKQVKSVFVRKRYREILSKIHLIDTNSPTCNRNSPEYDRLHNTRPMINILKRNFRDCFSLGCELSFDEFMIKFKGLLLVFSIFI